ncbi:hypothetical protein [Rhodococcus sp. 2G]|uniref:hypothetical protein n=1 Tax=Rhodococcus TaxID=1827 RepID=UPI0009043F97|nr:hypothetical protein [Rhodococcus sp. 2G]APE09715.1 hypothetical protein BO226_11280 [Rhodococcus sp. 2G]
MGDEVTGAGPGEVAQAAAAGDKRATLVAMRDRCARAIDDSSTPARDLAALTKRLSDFMDAIEEIDERAKAEAGSDDDNNTSSTDEVFDPEAL